MTIEPQSYSHRGYEIVVTHTPPWFQAAIYPKDPDLQSIAWEAPPIRAHNHMGALQLAKQRINETYAILNAG